MDHVRIPVSRINDFANRYTKNELKQDKNLLAFFDNSALGTGGLSDRFVDQAQQQIFLEYCKERKIHPVLSISVIGELVKGLPIDINKRQNLLEKKKVVLSILQELDLLWALPINFILNLEHSNLHASSSFIAHNYLKIFSEYPLAKIPKDSSRKSYPCDQYLNYSLGPDLTTVIYGGDIIKWLENEIIPELSIVQKDHEECKIKINPENSKIEELLPEKANINYSSFIFLWNKLRSSHYRKLNDRLDSFYAAFALGYCDYFIVNDKPLSDLTKKLAEELNLEVTTLSASEFFKA